MNFVDARIAAAHAMHGRSFLCLTDWDELYEEEMEA